MLVAFIIHIPVLFFLAYQFRKYYFNEPLSFFYWPGLLIKLSAGIAMALIYLFYYGDGGDGWVLNDQALKLNHFFYQDPRAYFNALLFDDYSIEIQEAVYRFYQPRAMSFIKILS